MYVMPQLFNKRNTKEPGEGDYFYITEFNNPLEVSCREGKVQGQINTVTKIIFTEEFRRN